MTPRLGFRPLGALFPVLAAFVGSLCALSAPAAPVPAAASLRAAPVAPPETHPLGSLDRLLDERRQRFLEAVRQRDPAAVVPLLGLSGLWAGVEDRPALAAFAAEAAKQGAAVSPLVLAQGLAVLREVTVHQGDLDGAARLLDALGIVPTYAVLGPFDNEGRKGHQAVYAPESEAESPDAAQVYPGKNPRTSLRWQEIPRGDLSLDGTLHFSTWLTPETQGTAYAVVYVQSQVRQPIALRVGSSGPVKVWVNRGQPPAVSSDAYHAPHMDQTVGSAMLETGWNRLLIKVSAVEKPWSLLLRLTRRLTGAPMAFDELRGYFASRLAEFHVRDALQGAPLSEDLQHRATHLLVSGEGILAVDDNVIPYLLKILNVNVDLFTRALDKMIASLPKVTGGGEQFLLHPNGSYRLYL